MTTRQLILDFIIAYFQKHGYALTVREIGAGVGLASTSSVHAHIKNLKRLGYLETDVKDGSPRALRVVGMEFGERK